METAALTLILVLLVVFIYLQFKIFKPKYPDESEVLGKDLPVGFRFVKDGKIVEVVAQKNCSLCVYYEEPLVCTYPKNIYCRYCRGVRNEGIIFKQVKK